MSSSSYVWLSVVAAHARGGAGDEIQPARLVDAQRRVLYSRSVAAEVAIDVCESDIIFCHTRTDRFDATAWTVGGHLFAHFAGTYWWADAGLGYVHAVFECGDPTCSAALGVFELAGAVGVRVPLGGHVALVAGVEVGTEGLVFSWRAQLTAGLEVHF